MNLAGAGFVEFHQLQLVNHRLEIAWCAVAVEIVARSGVIVFPLGDLLFVLCLGERPLGNNMSCDGLDVFGKIFLQVPEIIAEAAVGDMGLPLAFGAIRGRPGTARKRRSGKAADKGCAAALAVYAELVGFPDVQECR